MSSVFFPISVLVVPSLTDHPDFGDDYQYLYLYAETVGIVLTGQKLSYSKPDLDPKPALIIPWETIDQIGAPTTMATDSSYQGEFVWLSYTDADEGRLRLCLLPYLVEFPRKSRVEKKVVY